MFGVTSIFVNLSETMAEFGFLVSPLGCSVQPAGRRLCVCPTHWLKHRTCQFPTADLSLRNPATHPVSNCIIACKWHECPRRHCLLPS